MQKLVRNSIFVTKFTNVRATVYLYKNSLQVTQLSRLIKSRFSGVLTLLISNSCQIDLNSRPAILLTICEETIFEIHVLSFSIATL